MVAVTTVEPVEGYKLRLIVNDGSKRVVDLTADLWVRWASRSATRPSSARSASTLSCGRSSGPTGSISTRTCSMVEARRTYRLRGRAAGRVATHRTNVLPDRHPGPAAISARSPSWQRRRRHGAVREPARRPLPRWTHGTRKGDVRRQAAVAGHLRPDVRRLANTRELASEREALAFVRRRYPVAPRTLPARWCSTGGLAATMESTMIDSEVRVKWLLSSGAESGVDLAR
jgi:hypothetical protein